HGTFLVVERLGLADAIGRLWAPIRHVYLVIVVMIGWAFFRADTLAGAVAFLTAMAGLSPAMPTPYTVGWYLTPELWLALVRSGRVTGCHRACNAVLVALFAAIISLPLAANIAGHDGADAQAENRELALLPRFDAAPASIVDYAGALSRWFEDHFGFRATLVRWYAESRFFWLDVSPSPSVIKGRDHWLFYADDGGIEDYTNE